jgi:ribosomal protein L37AE/L43A
MVQDRPLNNAEIYHAFVNPNVSREEITDMSLEEATRMVASRRYRKVSQEWRDLPWSDEQIAQAILDYVHGIDAIRLLPGQRPIDCVRQNGIQKSYLDYSEGLVCHRCGRVAPTYPSRFQKNTSMIIVRTRQIYQGDFCQDCTKELFSACFWHCLVFGWWGIISAFITPFAIVENVYNYSRAQKFFRQIDEHQNQEQEQSDNLGKTGAAVLVVGGLALVVVLLFLVLSGYDRPRSSNQGPTVYTSQPAAALPTSTPRPSSKDDSNVTPAGSGTWWERLFTATPDLASVSSRSCPTNTARPSGRLPSPTPVPAHPIPSGPTPTGRDESFNQTVAAISDRLATDEANAAMVARQEAITPTPASCRDNVSISAPRHGSRIKGLVDIYGTATLPGFQFYKLEFSSRAQPTSGEWIAIGERYDQPVASGRLGMWDTSSLPAGQYWLQLVVVDETGNYPEPCSILVVVSK